MGKKKSKWNRFVSSHSGRGWSPAKMSREYGGGGRSNPTKGYSYKRAGKTVRVPARRNDPGLLPTSWTQITQGASFMDIAIAGIGVVAALTIPSMLKWNTGWKFLLAGLGTAAVGGVIVSAISRNKTVGKIFFACAFGTTLAMTVRAYLLKEKSAGLFGQDEEELFSNVGQDEELFDVGQDEELFDVGQEDEIYGTDMGQTDPIIRPTAGIEFTE